MLAVSLSHNMSGDATASHSRTVASALALATCFPSGLNATLEHDAGVAGERVAQTFTGIDVPQPHRAVQAGAGQAVPVGAERHGFHRPWCDPVSGSPRRSTGVGVPQPHGGIRGGGGQAVPVGAEGHARDSRRVLGAVSGSPSGAPVSAFHSRTVSSALAVASRCPSGLNATPVTASVWPVERGAEGLAGVGVPQPHRVVDAGAGQPVPVGAERHVCSPSRCGRSAGRRAGWPVSAFHNRTVLSSLAAGQPVPVGAERHIAHRSRCGR